MEVGTVLEPGIRTADGENNKAIEEAERQGIPVVLARAGDVYRVGRLQLRVLWPKRAGSRVGDPNDAAVVLLASFGSTDVLLTADAESHVTLPLRPQSVEIAKIAHHGSADEGLADLLRILAPRIAIVSTGQNDYGHPAPSTLATLEAHSGLAVYRTDIHGDVEIESDGSRVWVNTGG